MDEIRKITKKYKLYLISDSAHAIESEYLGKKLADWADISCYSFYPTKNITSGDGGMIVTNNKNWADKARILSLQGLNKDAWKRYSRSRKGSNFYEIIYNGYHFSMNDIAASLGLSQLSRLEKNWNKRKLLWKKYYQLLSDVNGIKLLSDKEDYFKHARHLFTILLDIDNLKKSREEIINQLKKNKIGTGIHFLALRLQKFYKKEFNYKKGDYPQAESISERILSLPLDVSLNNNDIKRIVNSLKRIVN